MKGSGKPAACCGAQEPFPSRKVARARGPLESISESVDEGGAPREYFSKPFEFLSLGLLAYVGAPHELRRRLISVCHCTEALQLDLRQPCQAALSLLHHA